jgi:hypothetical protein
MIDVPYSQRLMPVDATASWPWEGRQVAEIPAKG